jgi:hypothetical protein
MSYGLRYTITQKLRDETTLVLNIYENGYSGTNITSYDAVKLDIQPNSSGDDPLPSVVSSQLNISFVISTQTDFDNFPYLLSTDDRKYYVELVNGSNKLWVGFLFNDYVKVPFTTGYLQIDLIAIDGLSFLKSIPYYPKWGDSVNNSQNLIQTFAEALNLIGFPTQLQLLTSCSYFAEGMNNRSYSTDSDPFYQTYQYRRDYIDNNYYDIIENIVTSFNCRLFQADGLWQVININEVSEATRYFTKYSISPTISVTDSGILNKSVTIQPYVLNNVHFIDNSQNKVVRKGYNQVILDSKMDSCPNYATNGDFKVFDLAQSNPISGWTFNSSGSASSATFNQLDDLSNEVRLYSGTGSGDYAQLYIGNIVAPLTFKPYMVRPSFTLSFDYFIGNGQNGQVEISLRTTGGTVYYYNSSNNWQNTQAYYTITNNNSIFGGIYQSSSINVLLTYPNVPGTYAYEGYIGIRFYCDATHQVLWIKNVKITQKVAFPNSLSVINQISTNKSTIKSLTQPYGLMQNNSISKNYLGYLTDSSGGQLINWYRQGKTEAFFSLQLLIAKEYSNLLNRNFGTLESDLGAFQSSVGLLTLDKVYLVQDSPTNALSYDGKKFIANRLNITPQVNETTSFQLIEVSDTDLSTTQILIYS